MVKSKKQEIFRKLNSTSGVGDSDVGKWVFSYLFFQTNMRALEPGLSVSNKISSTVNKHRLFKITGLKLTFSKVLSDKIIMKLLLLRAFYN